MTYKVRYTKGARDDLRRLFQYLADRDLSAARRARATISKATEILEHFPFTCRKASPGTPFLRELVIPFGSGGHVALFDIEDEHTVTIIAVRHQREDDFH